MERAQPGQAAGTPAAYYYAATLTVCAGTWLAQAPDASEQRLIDEATKEVRERRKLAIAFHQQPRSARLFSLELFRGPPFAPLHMHERLIAEMLAVVGELPIDAADSAASEAAGTAEATSDTADAEHPTFARYLRRATLHIATARVRSALAGQLRRFLPGAVMREAWQEALAIDHNAFRTALGNEATPFLVQMTLGGLVRWYEAHEG